MTTLPRSTGVVVQPVLFPFSLSWFRAYLCVNGAPPVQIPSGENFMKGWTINYRKICGDTLPELNSWTMSEVHVPPPQLRPLRPLRS